MVNGAKIRLYGALFMFLILGVDSVAHSQSVFLFSRSFAEKMKTVLRTTKKRCKKVFDCIIGNDETCKPDEIIAVRLALFVFCAGMYQIREKRRISEVTAAMRPLLDSRRDELDRRRPEDVDLNARRVQGSNEPYYDEPSYLEALDRAVEQSLRQGSDKPIKEATDQEQETIRKKRTAFLEGIKKQEADKNQSEENSNDSQENSGDLKCAVCLVENKANMDYIPCDQIYQNIPPSAHSDKMCLECLSTQVVNAGACPICREKFELFN